MSNTTVNYQDWIGRSEQVDDDLSLAQSLAAAAIFDDTTTVIEPGAALPPLWHWFYFLPRAPQALLSDDGHPQRGGFLPPISYPRRMFAGSRLRFHQPLRIGQPAQRLGEIRDIVLKSGRSGHLAFVTVAYRLMQDGELCIEEQQDIVYREPGLAVPAPTPSDWSPVPEGAWSRTVTPDPRLLFRFSALTFNAHRIHYDRPYALNAEGYPGLVVHGPLTAMLLLNLVRQSSRRPIIRFSFRGRAPLFDLAPFRLLGQPEGDQVKLEAQGPDGQVALSATAEWG